MLARSYLSNYTENDFNEESKGKKGERIFSKSHLVKWLQGRMSEMGVIG